MGTGTPVVTAVLVTHDGAQWLPTVLTSLGAQTVPPDLLLAVDTASTDASLRILDESAVVDAVLPAARDSGFGAAVALALGSPDAAALVVEPDSLRWIWLLHDDAELAPDALEHLLAAAARRPSVAVLGPKLSGWDARDTLLEVGVSIAGSGRRETGLEAAEVDQGQHDDERDVLSVSTAGMLVRRDVWDQLTGLDPALPLFRDDVDLGWRARSAGHDVVCVPAAQGWHVEAAARGMRPIAARASRSVALPRRRAALDRRAALHVLLANASPWRLPLVIARSILGGLLRSLVALLGKVPSRAADELLALLGALGRPDVLHRARRSRRPLRGGDERVRPFLPGPVDTWRRIRDAFAATGLFEGAAAQDATARGAVETGPTDEETDDLAAGPSLLGVLARPSVAMLLVLAGVALLADRTLLGTGSLRGGALLPAPRGASDLWHAATSSWEPVLLGSPGGRPSFPAVLALLAVPFGAKPSIVVAVLLLACIPLAGLTAYAALRPWLASRALRAWAAASYALLPTAPAAVAQGRLGPAVTHIGLPLLAAALARALGGRPVDTPSRRDDRSAGRVARAASGAASRAASRAASWPAAWTAALLLAALSSAVPVLWPMVAVVLITATVVGPTGRGRRAAGAVVVLGVPALLLWPQTVAIVDRPELLAGISGLAGAPSALRGLDPLAVVLLHPGGAGSYPMIFTVPLLLAALAALLRHGAARRVAVGCWTVALPCLVLATLLSRTTIGSAASGRSATAWSGSVLSVAGGALVVAAAAGGAGLRRHLAQASFGLRQPLTLLALGLVAAAPLAAAESVVARGSAHPLERRVAGALPAFVAAEQTGRAPSAGGRTLVISGAPTALRYTVVRGAGASLGQAEGLRSLDMTQARAAAAASLALDSVVGDLTSGRSGGAAEPLSDFAIGYVLAVAPASAEVVRALDTVPGLARVGAGTGQALWRVGGEPPARVRVVQGKLRTPVPSRQVGADAALLAGPEPRLLVLAEVRDHGWRATLDGRRLPVAQAPASAAWAQAFALPTTGGRLLLSHVDVHDRRVDLARGLLALLALLLALPSASRGRPPGGQR